MTIEIGQSERKTQNRVMTLFETVLGYSNYGSWQYRDNNRNIETEILSAWLTARGVDGALITQALRQLDLAARVGRGAQSVRCEQSGVRAPAVWREGEAGRG